MSESLERFEEVSRDYETFREMIPKYRQMMEVMQEIFDQFSETTSPRRVCELGVGTGNFAEKLIRQFAPDQFLGLDGAGEMIDEARQRLGMVSEGTRIELRQTRFENWVPETTYDWIYSSLSIHHLSDMEKRSLYRRIHDALRSRGKFLLCDLVKVTGKHKRMVRQIYKNRLKSAGFSEEQIERRWAQHEKHDRPSALRATIRWLRETGFDKVECIWKDLNRVILVSFRS